MVYYEVREDASSDPVYPFYIFSHEDGKPLPDRFVSREEAQKNIEIIERASEYDNNLFNDFFLSDELFPFVDKKKTPPKDVVFFDGPYVVGAIILDRDDNRYQATEKSYYLSAREVADLEDGWDVTEQAGWHTPATLIEEEE